MPRESIPVGGWRSAEQRTVEVAYGKAKARDVVPGWPRGRSTSRPYPKPLFDIGFLERGAAIWDSYHWDDWRRYCDQVERLAEERRKADMMEAWYEKQRIAARLANHVYLTEEMFDMGFEVMAYRWWKRTVSNSAPASGQPSEVKG